MDDGTTVVEIEKVLPDLPPLPKTGLTTIDDSTGQLTPSVSMDPVAGASYYRILIINDTDNTLKTFDGVPGDTLSTTPEFIITRGVLKVGKEYRLRVEAFDGPTSFTSNRRSTSNFEVYSTLDLEEGIIGVLIPHVEVLDLGNGAENSLTSKLLSALKSLDKGNAGPAKNQLGAFINEVEALLKKGQLTEAEADFLIAQAELVIDVI